jgi:hypothetical protein
METQDEKEAKLLTDYRRMSSGDKAFLEAFANSSVVDDHEAIPSPKILAYQTKSLRARQLYG